MASPDTATKELLGLEYLLIPFLIFVLISVAILGIYFWNREKIEKYWFKHKTVRVVFFALATCMIPLAAGAWADVTDASRILGGEMYRSDLNRINLLAALIATYVSSQVVWWMHGDAWQGKLKKLYLSARRQESLKKVAREERDFVLELASSYSGVVGMKGDRVRESINNNSKQMTVTAALDPSLQIVKLIHATFGIFKASLKQASQKSKIRLAFFEVDGRHLKRVHAWDGQTQNCLQMDEASQNHNLAIAQD